LKDFANKRIPLPARNLSEKDQDLLKKVSLIAQAVEVPKPPLIGTDVSNISYLLDQRAIRNGRDF